jgi:hypothetical protein
LAADAQQSPFLARATAATACMAGFVRFEKHPYPYTVLQSEMLPALALLSKMLPTTIVPRSAFALAASEGWP